MCEFDLIMQAYGAWNCVRSAEFIPLQPKSFIDARVLIPALRRGKALECGAWPRLWEALEARGFFLHF